jgi:hypothetical protein
VLKAQGLKRPLLLACLAKRYTEEHEVIAYDDATSKATLYITDYASKSLGDVVFVELPKEGTQVAKGGKPLIPYTFFAIVCSLN